MRALLIATTVLLAACGDGGEEAAFEPEAVESTSADEARAIAEAEEMLDNRLAVPGGIETPTAQTGPSDETVPEGSSTQ